MEETGAVSDALSFDPDGDVAIDFMHQDTLFSASVSPTGRMAYAWRDDEDRSGSGTVQLDAGVFQCLAKIASGNPHGAPEPDEQA